MANKGIGVGECEDHGEFFLDAEDSPCPSCEDDVKKWQVIVGNIGTVYDDNNGFKAKQEYSAYKKLSIAGTGRAGGESVTLWKDGEPEWEHHGTVDQEED